MNTHKELKFTYLYMLIRRPDDFQNVKALLKGKEKSEAFLKMIEETANEIKNNNPNLFEVMKSNKTLLKELWNQYC